MNVNLTPQLDEMVRDKVDSGMYNSASEVVREALRMMQEHDQLRAVKLEALRREIQEGIDSGEMPFDPEAIKRAGRARRAARKR